jgi:uncharacterized protein YkwD
MGRARTLPSLGAALALLALGAAPASACRHTRVVPGAGSVDEVRSATVCLINVQRSDRGLRPLRLDGALVLAAQRHSQDMVRRDYFAHVSRDGHDLVDRMRQAGWRPRGAWTAGENIAWGTGSFGDAQSVVSSWMRSSGHRANILNRRFREIGVGVARGVPGHGLRGGTYTADFAGF